MASLNDFLKGKEKTIKADPLAGDINSAAKSGITGMQDAYKGLSENVYGNPQETITSQIGMENKLMRSAADDAVRRTRQLVSQRGLSGSSIGLGQEVNQAKQLNDKLSMNNASYRSRLGDLYKDQMATGQGLFNLKTAAAQSGLQMQNTKYRSGGLAPLVGAGVGAYFGGAQGAQAGAGIGQMYANS